MITTCNIGSLFRHKKTGGVYRPLMVCELESDLTEMVVYKNIDTGRVWVRPVSEFYDGRFEPISPIDYIGSREK